MKDARTGSVAITLDPTRIRHSRNGKAIGDELLKDNKDGIEDLLIDFYDTSKFGLDKRSDYPVCRLSSLIG